MKAAVFVQVITTTIAITIDSDGSDVGATKIIVDGQIRLTTNIHSDKVPNRRLLEETKVFNFLDVQEQHNTANQKRINAKYVDEPSKKCCCATNACFQAAAST